MPPTKAALRKHRRHLLMLAAGVKHERDYVLKTALDSLEPLLHSIAVDAVNSKLHIPVTHRPKLVRYANATADERKRMSRPYKKGQHGSGLLSFLGSFLGELGSTVLGLFK